MPTRLIIGAGTSAAVFLQTMDTEYDTVVVGEDGLWAKLPDHPMGQPSHLLHLPGTPVPRVGIANGEQDLQGFLASATYQDQVSRIVSGHRYGYQPTRRIRRISRSLSQPGKFVAWFNQDAALIVNQVIIATGIGPQKGPPTIEGVPSQDLAFTPIIEGIQFLENEDERTPRIDRAIYGGGATSAWVAALAMQTSERMGWFARSGGTEFSGSVLPGNRNALVIKACEDLNLKALENIEKIEVVGTRLRIHVTGKDYCYLADQFIYSLGGDDHTAASSIYAMLDANIRDTLVPYKDINGALGRIGDGTLAWTTPEDGQTQNRVMIVGAATYNFTKPNTRKQSAPMGDLPWNAQVADGVAVVTASISALNTFIPIKQRMGNKGGDGWYDVDITENFTNLNIADRNQLAVLFTLMFDEWHAGAIELLVNRVIAERSKKEQITRNSHEVFGIDLGTLFALVKEVDPSLENHEISFRCRLVGLTV